MRPSDANLLSSIERHDAEIAGLRADIHAMRNGLDQINTTMGDIKAWMLTAQANKPMPPLEALQRYVSIAQSLGVLIGMIVVGIVYVSSNANSGEVALLKWKMEQVLAQRGTVR